MNENQPLYNMQSKTYILYTQHVQDDFYILPHFIHHFLSTDFLNIDIFPYHQCL